MKENLKPCVYKLSEHVSATAYFFRRTVRRVMIRGKVKDLRSGAEAKASVKSTRNHVS